MGAFERCLFLLIVFWDDNQAPTNRLALIVLMMVLRRKWISKRGHYLFVAMFAMIDSRVRYGFSGLVDSIKCCVGYMLKNIAILIESHNFVRY